MLVVQLVQSLAELLGIQTVDKMAMTRDVLLDVLTVDYWVRQKVEVLVASLVQMTADQMV